MSKASEKIIVALDTSSLEAARGLLEKLEGVISFYKIGTELFTAHGWQALELVRRHGGKVFLDLKLHDIPNTVSKTMTVICEHEVDMVTLHALGGLEMMRTTRKTVEERAGTGKNRPKLLGVTILTSHHEEELSSELGMAARPLQEQVLSLGRLALQAGMDGLVSSAGETAFLRKSMPQEFLMVTPGVRPEGSEKSDQKRTFTPVQALEAGSDYLVIGRPITAAACPREAAQAIIQSISSLIQG